MSAGMLLVVSCSKVDFPKQAQDANGSPGQVSKTASAQDWTKSVGWLFSPQATPAPLTDAKPPTAPVTPPPTTAAASPVFQPNPALGAKEAAMKMYPQLAIKDSTFNKTFRDLYVEESQKNPELLTKADWPLILAHRTADILTPPAQAQPQPPAMPQTQFPAARSGPQVADVQSRGASPTPSSNPLDRGAYNQTRSPSYYYYWPWVRYY